MAKVMFGASPTSKVIRTKLLNSAFTDGRGLTGLSFSASGLTISTIKANETSATYYTASANTIETVATLGTYATPTASKCRFREVDSTYHKGVYELQFSDARFSATDYVTISIAGATNLVENDFEIQTNLGRAAYPDGFIYYDSAASNTNTVIGIDGLPSNPVSTPAAAITLADALGTKNINITGTWTNSATMTGYHFRGNPVAALVHNNTNMTGCTFEYLDLRGINTGSSNIYYKVTTLNTYTIAGVIYESEVGNTVSITGYSNLFNCQPTNNGLATMVFTSAAQSVNIGNFLASSVTVSGVTNAGSNISIGFEGNPNITIDSSCNAGTIIIMGFINSLTNNSTGTCIVIDNRNNKGLASAVWDEPRSNHTISATFGENVCADLIKINNHLTNGNNATLYLKQLNINNDSGNTAINVQAIGTAASFISTQANAVEIISYGSEEGGNALVLAAGPVGNAIYAVGGDGYSGSVAGNSAIYAYGGKGAPAAYFEGGYSTLFPDSHGVLFAGRGTGDGIKATNLDGAGSGATFEGGPDGGHGVVFRGLYTGRGAYFVGGDYGDAILVLGGGEGTNGNGDGITVYGGRNAGNGITAYGYAYGHGMALKGGITGNDLSFGTPSCTFPIVDGISTSTIMSNILSMVSGKFSKDVPNPGDVTFYKQDNITPAFIMHITANQRTRTYQAP